MWLVRTEPGFASADDDSVKLYNKTEVGELVAVKLIRVRSVPWHRWYFASCAEIGRNQDPERSTETIDYAIRFWSGHVEETRDKRGRVLEVAKRLAFDKLDADEWARLWPTFELTMMDKFGFDPVRFKDMGNGW